MTKHIRPGGLRIEYKDDAGALPPELKTAINGFSVALEEFKAANDARIKALEGKSGSVDVLITEKTDRINAALDQLKADVNAELVKLKRPAIDPTDKKAAQGLAEFKAMAERASVAVRFKDDAEALDAMNRYKAASNRYLRVGRDALTPDELKELSVGTATEGGYLVMPERSNRIITKIFETTPFRQIAGQVSVGTNRLTLPIDRDEAGSGGWVGEQTPRTESTTPAIGELDIDVHEQYAQPQITQNMIDDSSIDIEAWLDMKVADKLARTENTAFITGNGVRQPYGILSYPVANTADASRAFGTLEYVFTGASGAFASSNPADKILDLIYALKPGYRQGAVFLGARRTIAAVRKLKDGQGNYLAGPRLADGAFVESIFGFGVVEGEDMPAIAADSYSLAFGNFREGYLIVDRSGIRQLRDPLTTKGKVKIYSVKRSGGAIINTDAIKLLKFGTS